jgi:nucleotide-binding universal stress UspA family protein
VPIGNTAGSWDALDQAILIAQREQANILALHTVESRRELDSAEVKALQDQFNLVCSKEIANGVLAIEVGDPTQKILERAALADLIVIKIAHPPSTGIRSLGSQVRTLIARASRPILAIPGMISSFQHALLAFDGSPKAKEALFVATYLAEQWKTELTIFTGLSDESSDSSIQEFAQNYLEFNEIEARFITERYSPETFKSAAEEINADLIIMGGYSGSILKEMTIGSSVNYMMRESQLPVLICR